MGACELIVGTVKMAEPTMDDLSKWTMRELRDSLDEVTEERRHLYKQIQKDARWCDAEQLENMNAWAKKVFDEIRRRDEPDYKKLYEETSATIKAVKEAIAAAREWGDDHNVVGREGMLSIIESALPPQ